MKIDIEIISREMVTPSSPTPPHLKTYNLSSIDQAAPPFLMPHVFFYPANHENPISNSVRSNRLKKSLSQALTMFYPLAGRLVGNSHVNCSDEGVTYNEAQADCNLLDVVTNPNPEEIILFVPCKPDEDIDLCLVVQATFFSCGGLAIGLAISHRVVDGISYFMFVKNWAAMSSQHGHGLDPTHQLPIFETAALFPPRDDLSDKRQFYKKGTEENIVSKRFVFGSTKIEDLRNEYTKNTTIRPTRIETLSAFIWTRFMFVTGAKDNSSKVHALRITVDIRTRLVPPLSEYHFGNIINRTFAIPSLKNDEDRYGVVKKIRDAIRNVDQEHVNKIPGVDDEVVVFKFTSLCRLPLYESDFGWGKPMWVGPGKIPRNNIVFFMDSTSSGGGIDAWVNMREDDMVRFEADEELNRYISCVDDAKHIK